MTEPFYYTLQDYDAGLGCVDLWLEESPYGLPPQHLATLVMLEGLTSVPMVALHSN